MENIGMPIDEAVMWYKQAKNQRKQIRILADMACCTVADMREYLRLGGLDVPEPAKWGRAEPRKWTDEDVLMLFRARGSGMSFPEIAIRLDRCLGSVSKKFYARATRQQIKRLQEEGLITEQEVLLATGQRAISEEQQRRRERKREYDREWRERNKGKILEYRRAYNARIKQEREAKRGGCVNNMPYSR